MTTEYERLNAALDGACRRQEAQVEAGQMFADNLTDAFADYLGCPRRVIASQPERVDVRDVGLQPFDPDEAVVLRADGWFGFRITLQFSPVRHVSFPVSFARSGDYTWTVRLTRGADVFEIADCLDGAENAFAAWVNLAADGFATSHGSVLPSGRHGIGVEVGVDVARGRERDLVERRRADGRGPARSVAA